jgi:hypothetical protein
MFVVFRITSNGQQQQQQCQAGFYLAYQKCNIHESKVRYA